MLLHKIRIAEVRKKKGLTQSELASLSGVNRSIIAKVEADICEPKLSTLIKLSKALDVSIAEMIKD